MSLKIQKHELVLIALCLGLCILVIGMSLKYNRLVADYNKIANEANEFVEEHCFVPKPIQRTNPFDNINFSKFAEEITKLNRRGKDT